MRTTLLTGFAAVIFSSCSKYQYFSLSGDSVSKNDKQEFMSDSDSLKILYNFYGDKGPVTITIYNKSAEALEIDWKRSALIVGDVSRPYFDADMHVNGEIAKNGSERLPTSSIDADIRVNEALEFIPPHASITRTNGLLGIGFIKEIAPGSGKRSTDPAITQIHYTKTNSPVSFRSYLTFLRKNGETFSVDHDFYVSSITEIKTNPDSFKPASGDQFYARSKTRFGKMSGLVGGIVILGLIFTVAQ